MNNIFGDRLVVITSGFSLTPLYFETSDVKNAEETLTLSFFVLSVFLSLGFTLPCFLLC